MAQSFNIQPTKGASLWSFLANTERCPGAIALLGSIEIGVRLIARLPVEMAGGLLLGGIMCAFVGRSLYRRKQRSLKRIMLFFQLSGWPLAFTLFGLAWNGAYLTGIHARYLGRGELVASIFGTITILLSYYYANFWRAGANLYSSLASYRSSGRINSSELLFILSFQGRSIATQKLALSIGLAVSLFMVIFFLFPKDVIGLCVFVVLGLLIPPYILAVLIARLILMKKYLGSDDLLIED